MMDRSRLVRRLAPALTLVVALVASWVLIKAWPTWQASRLADSWREQLETAEDDRVPVLVDQLVDLGDAGLERLVAALASPRLVVRQHAAATLGKQVDHWELCDVSARSAAAAKLSSALAARVDAFPADARENAASLVQQMLAWQTDDAFVDRMQLVAACETVLLATDQGDIESPNRIAIARRDERRPQVDESGDVAALARLPGGGLAIEPTQPPSLPRVDDPPERTAPRDPREPRLLPDGAGESLPPAPLPIVDPAVDPARRASAPPEGKNSSRPANYQSSVGNEQSVAIANSQRGESPNSLRPFDGPRTEREMSLVRLLHSDHSVAGEAEKQLRALGFGDLELHLATLLGSPDAKVRQRFVESLPRIAGVRPRRWLEIMLDDEDAAVRLAAMTQLATSGDAALVESLARRAQLDPDPEVRRQAERLRGIKSR